MYLVCQISRVRDISRDADVLTNTPMRTVALLLTANFFV